MFKSVSPARFFAGFCLGMAVLSGVILGSLIQWGSTTDNKSYALGQGCLRLPAMGLSFVGMCAGLGEIFHRALAKNRPSYVILLATIANAVVLAFSIIWERSSPS